MFPLIVLVVFAGLLLGGGLAKLLGRGGSPSPAPSFTPLPGATVAAMTSPAAVPSRGPSPSPRPSALSSVRPSPSSPATSSPSPSPALSASAKPSPTPKATPTVLIMTPTPAPARTARPNPPTAAAAPTATPAPLPTPTPATITGAASSDHALAIGRSYVSALIDGQAPVATGYLTSGLATETYLQGGKIADMDVAKNPDGSFRVSARVSAPSGTYLLTLRIVSTSLGMQITDHSATKG